MIAAYRKGLKLSIAGSGDLGYPCGYEQLLWQAARMSAVGASGAEIMDMMTVKPAEALGWQIWWERSHRVLTQML